jgi:NAD(P)-dependent dehydrogenase (short-subunit alcohol dehydrogenase family)
MSTEDTILVVGGTGTLGEQVARQLHRDGFEVRVLARDVERARTLLGPDSSTSPVTSTTETSSSVRL